MRRAWIALAVLCAALIAGPALAGEERIIRFASDVVIGTDGVLTVTETLVVEAAGIQIRHGIFRDFPTVAQTATGGRKRFSFDVVDVTRDGGHELYTLESIPNGRRVKIGDADTYVTPGVHTYVLTYRTDRQIGFFDEIDELYWNVTGNFWAFTIESAETTIHLPPGAQIRQWRLYTGYLGARDEDAIAKRIDDRTIRFITSKPLYSGEGLTVAVGFSKGVVSPPTRAQQNLQWLRDNAPAAAAGFGLLVLLAYYIATWLRYGRDPDMGTVIPLFAPPDDLSPAAVRYVHRMAFDQKAFSAALISMAVKGYLKIDEDDDDYRLNRQGKSEDEAGLDDAERAIAATLFAGRDSIVLKQSNHATLSQAIRQLSASLQRNYQPRYFVTNRMWLYGGIALTVASIAAVLFFSGAGEDVIGPFVSMGVWAVAFGFMGSRALPAWRGALASPGFLGTNLIGALFTTGFGLVFFGVITATLVSVGQSAGLIPAMVFLAIQAVSALVFSYLLKAPTVEGAKARGAIQGFRMYLETAEKERLEILHPPKVTPEVFEKFLPFAIALDAENAWSRRFEAEAIEAGQTPPESGYSPRWYSGSGSRSFSQLGTAGLASMLGSSVASAATSPASSGSGGGGGGSSGGGGGGGGGGGW